MMDCDPEQKTEAPTPFRREAAREFGQVARSRDLVVAVSLLGGFALAGILGPWLGSRTEVMARSFLVAVVAEPEALSMERLSHLAAAAGSYLLLVFLPVAAAFALSGAAVASLQGGLAFQAALAAPDASRLNPLQGARKLFSARSPARGAFAAAKIVLVGWLLVATVRSVAAEGFSASAGATAARPASLVSRSWSRVTGFGMRLGSGLLVLALLDYALERWLHERSLRMTPAELREEITHLEGDPNLKNRRRRVWLKLRRDREH